MNYHLVILVTDPDLAYIVRGFGASKKDMLNDVMFENENTIAIFKDAQRAKEYAAYLNLKLYA